MTRAVPAQHELRLSAKNAMLGFVSCAASSRIASPIASLSTAAAQDVRCRVDTKDAGWIWIFCSGLQRRRLRLAHRRGR